MNNIKMVVFDLAGTTVKDNGDMVNLAFRKALLTHGYDVTGEQVNKYMGLPKPLAIKSIMEEKDKHVYTTNTSLIDKVHNEFVKLMVDYYTKDSSVGEIEGTSDTFLYLQNKGIKVCVNTGFSKVIADAVMKRMQWIECGLVDFMIASDEVKEGRPAPDMIFELMKLCQIQFTKEVCKVGDTPADLKEGYHADCGLIVGVTEGSHSLAQLNYHHHHHLIPNVSHLKNLL